MKGLSMWLVVCQLKKIKRRIVRRVLRIKHKHKGMEQEEGDIWVVREQ